MTRIYEPNQIISVFIEHHNNIIEPVSYELIGKAKKLAAENNMDIHGIICKSRTQKLNLDLLKYSVDHIDIYYYRDNYNLNTLDYRNCLIKHIYQYKPMIVLVGATHLGRTFAPRVAAYFGTGITADCTELEYNNENGLIQIRPAYGGDVIAQIVTPDHYPQMATVRPGVMEKSNQLRNNKGTTKAREIKCIQNEIKILKKEKIRDKITKLEDTEIVIIAGNAIKYPEELNLIIDLARLIGGEWAVTRPLVEGGLAPHDRQIGVSGKTTRPKIGITFGVSGTTQTLSGISKSEKIIAVNMDENAPIFKNSDIGILNDWKEVAEGLIKKIMRRS